MSQDKQDRVQQLEALMDFVANAPANQAIIDMDCNDHCEHMAALAEQVAQGADLSDVMPELQQHMRYWGDCREEFMALVAVLKAEMQDDASVAEPTAHK
jgi:hypothetical protein